MRKQKRVGIYAWAGSGTLRLLKTKYHNPKIDEKSLLTAYDNPPLKKQKELFGVTDAWVTYSWGFSDKTEAEDYRFITSRLGNFKKNQIKTHAYIQGFNLVTSEFKNIDPWCRDFKGRLLPYSRGRSLTCPNNPAAVKIIQDRVLKACREDFDGIFIDNIFFGLPPLILESDYMSFCGCSCIYCQKKFEKEFGYALSLNEKRGKQVVDYIKFRIQSTYEVLKKLQRIAKATGKQFGVNLYDPVSYTPEVYFGYSLENIKDLLSYYLIENLSLPSQIKHNNSYFSDLIKNTKKPVFIVSYNKGIGLDSEYLQKDIDFIFSEASELGYSVCLKTSEYKTKNTWHYIYSDNYQKPKILQINLPKIQIRARPLRKSQFVKRVIGYASSFVYTPVSQMIWDSRLVYLFMVKTRVLTSLMKKQRRVSF